MVGGLCHSCIYILTTQKKISNATAEFKAYAVEMSGCLSKSAHWIIRFIARNSPKVDTAAGYSVRVRQVMERLSVALWKGNARMIRRWQTDAFNAPAAAAVPVANAAAVVVAPGPGAAV